MSVDKKSSKVSLIETPKMYFSELVQSALAKRRLNTQPAVSHYLVGLLESYLNVEMIKNEATLAETLLRAQLAEKKVKSEMLKRLGDTSLYVSGFFGDSLRRKIIDIDYYADIGGTAYGYLASQANDEGLAYTYKEFSLRFLDYVDLLTYISQNSMIQSNQDLLRLYERYVMTGSELAKEQLLEKGLLTTTDQNKKASNQ
jgi:Mor family transcriptional regulator